MAEACLGEKFTGDPLIVGTSGRYEFRNKGIDVFIESLKQLAAPCILYNLNGYYDHLKALLAHMIDMGLSTPERQEGIYFAEMLDDIRTILKI